MIEELARHAGQGDIIRESIDGATLYELLAGIEGWPATDWLTPWGKAAVSGRPVGCGRNGRDARRGPARPLRSPADPSSLFYEDLGDPRRAARSC